MSLTNVCNKKVRPSSLVKLNNSSILFKMNFACSSKNGMSLISKAEMDLKVPK